MRTPPTIMGAVMESRWLREPWRRRAMFFVIGIVLAILSIWPEHYAAEAQLLPQDSGGGLSAALASQGGQGGLLSLGALLGNKQPVEADLTIARSHAVLDIIVARMHLLGHHGFGDLRQAEAKLRNRLGIIAIRGSILQITTRDRDPVFARDLAAATAAAIQQRLGEVSLVQAAQKRGVAENRFQDATVRLAQTQAALNRFRTENQLAAPPEQLGLAVGQLASLEARLQAKQVEIATLRRFSTGGDIRMQAAEAELTALQNQVEAAKVAAPQAAGSNLAGLAAKNAEYFNLYRDEKSAEILYEVYRRYLEEVVVEDLSANQNLVLVEPAYIQPERQFNIWAVGLLAINILLFILAEFYVLRPPIAGRPGSSADGV